ncbi:uncharacterized protein LOC144490716 [Mustelus asterias]
MKLLKLLPTLGLLFQLTETVKTGGSAATDQIIPPGIAEPRALKYSEAVGNSWRNSTQENGGPAGFSAGSGRTNTIVAVFFVSLVIILMSVSLYLTLMRKGCGRQNWKIQVDEESLH